jgi:RNA polymerase sigma-70 factor (ECF subfamily)
VALNCLRRSLRRQRHEAVLLRRPRPANPPVPLPHPELWAEVRSLPERQRIAVVLRYVADLPEAEIAEAMGVARGTVAATLSAARKQLALRLGADSEEAHHG